MARLSRQLRFEILKYFDTDVMINIDPGLDQPYYWRQMVPAEMIFRSDISLTTMYAADIRANIITRADLVEAFTLCNERFDPLALLLLDPIVSASLIYSQRAEYYPAIKQIITHWLRNIIEDDSHTALTYMANFFKVIDLDVLLQFLPREFVQQKNGALHILQVIIGSGNAKLFVDAFLYYNSNFAYDRDRYSTVLTMACSLNHRVEMMDFLQEQHLIHPLTIMGHVNIHYTDIAIAIEENRSGRIRPIFVIIDLILQRQFEYLKIILTKLGSSKCYYDAITAMILAGYYDHVPQMFSSLGNDKYDASNMESILDTISLLLRINFVETGITVTTSAIPSSWIKWLGQVPAIVVGLFFVAAINDDLSTLQQLIRQNNIMTDPILNANYKRLCMTNWQIFAPHTCAYLMQQFGLAHTLRLRFKPVFPMNVETVQEQLPNIVDVAHNIDTTLPQELVVAIINRTPMLPNQFDRLHLDINGYLDEISRQLVSPDLRDTIIAALASNLIPLGSEYVERAKIFVQLPRQLQLLSLDKIIIAEKADYYRTLIAEQE